MIKIIDKNSIRTARHKRIRGKISGSEARPRLNVFRSTNHIYAQIINDEVGNTLVSCSTLEKSLLNQLKGKNKKEQATIVGEAVAKKALSKGITEVVFDRGGYVYMGRVECLADGARETGLKF